MFEKKDSRASDALKFTSQIAEWRIIKGGVADIVILLVTWDRSLIVAGDP